MALINLSCPNCGGSVDPDINSYCSYCGAKFKYISKNEVIKIELVPTPSVAYCHICGRANEKINTFHCIECGKTHLCLDHQGKQNVCSKCY